MDGACCNTERQPRPEALLTKPIAQKAASKVAAPAKKSTPVKNPGTAAKPAGAATKTASAKTSPAAEKSASPGRKTAAPEPAHAPAPVSSKQVQLGSALVKAAPASLSMASAEPSGKVKSAPLGALGGGTAIAEAPAPRKPSRSASKYSVAQMPLPVPAATSRFADRFAPPRPPTRQMKNLELDVPRHTQKSDPKLANAWKTKSGRELSEAEILAMPESEYMNEKQLEFFRLKLQSLKDDLLSNAGETTEHLREDTSIVPDPADRATIEEEHALELRTRDRERKLLKKISQSLGRIESGDYGFCDETGEPIGLGRLIARPTATLSLEAQQRRELKQKMFGD